MASLSSHTTTSLGWEAAACNAQNPPGSAVATCKAQNLPGWAVAACKAQNPPGWAVATCKAQNLPGWAVAACKAQNFPGWAVATCKAQNPLGWAVAACKAQNSPGWAQNYWELFLRGLRQFGDPDTYPEQLAVVVLATSYVYCLLSGGSLQPLPGLRSVKFSFGGNITGECCV